MMLHELAGKGHEVGGLGVGIADALDILKDLRLVGSGHRRSIREALEESRGHQVHALVSTLGAEDHSHQQLEHGTEV